MGGRGGSRLFSGQWSKGAAKTFETATLVTTWAYIINNGQGQTPLPVVPSGGANLSRFVLGTGVRWLDSEKEKWSPARPSTGLLSWN